MDPLELDSTRELEPLAVSNNVDTPLRPKASPRSTPSPTSVRSSFPSHQSRSATSSGEEGSPIRGRTLVRVPAHERPELLQASSHSGDPYIATMRQRFLSQDLSNEPEDLDRCYMEPLPFERFRSSLSEELHKVATFNSSIDLTNFGGHRDTFAVLGLRRMQIQGPELPATFFRRLLHYINFQEYLAVRLSCRYWSAGTYISEPRFPVSHQILSSLWGS